MQNDDWKFMGVESEEMKKEREKGAMTATVFGICFILISIGYVFTL
jgi:hypothetical protein